MKIIFALLFSLPISALAQPLPQCNRKDPNFSQVQKCRTSRGGVFERVQVGIAESWRTPDGLVWSSPPDFRYCPGDAILPTRDHYQQALYWGMEEVVDRTGEWDWTATSSKPHENFLVRLSDQALGYSSARDRFHRRCIWGGPLERQSTPIQCRYLKTIENLWTLGPGATIPIQNVFDDRDAQTGAVETPYLYQTSLHDQLVRFLDLKSERIIEAKSTKLNLKGGYLRVPHVYSATAMNGAMTVMFEMPNRGVEIVMFNESTGKFELKAFLPNHAAEIETYEKPRLLFSNEKIIFVGLSRELGRYFLVIDAKSGKIEKRVLSTSVYQGPGYPWVGTGVGGLWIPKVDAILAAKPDQKLFPVEGYREYRAPEVGKVRMIRQGDFVEDIEVSDSRGVERKLIQPREFPNMPAWGSMAWVIKSKRQLALWAPKKEGGGTLSICEMQNY